MMIHLAVLLFTGQTLNTKMKDLFEVNLYDLKAGDQFEEGSSEWNIWEVFSNNNRDCMKVFQVDIPLYREDGTTVRNMLFSRRYDRFSKRMVKPIINKRPVLNRNHQQYGFPDTWLYGKDELTKMIETKSLK